MSTSEQRNVVRLNLKCSPEFYDKAHNYARERGQTVSAVMREALIERMDREKQAKLAAEAELRSQMRVGSAAVNEILRGPFK